MRYPYWLSQKRKNRTIKNNINNINIAPNNNTFNFNNNSNNSEYKFKINGKKSIIKSDNKQLNVHKRDNFNVFSYKQPEIDGYKYLRNNSS